MEKELLYIGSNGHVAAIVPETGDEALAIGGKSIQFVSTHTHS
jgi:hypothetical protein